MEEVEKLFKNSTEEMEKLLTAKSVVGEPMVVDGCRPSAIMGHI